MFLMQNINFPPSGERSFDEPTSPLSDSFIWNRVRDNRLNDSSSVDDSFEAPLFDNDVTDNSIVERRASDELSSGRLVGRGCLE